MDFNSGKFSHILALLMLIGSFIFIFVLPIVSFFVLLDSPQLIESISISETSAIISQIIVIAVFILVPFAWYILVNKLDFKGILERIKLVGQNIDRAFLWGIIAAIIIFVAIFAIELVLISLGHSPQDLSNIPDIQRLFSWPTMFLLVAIQPIGEEIFFRGFLFEKIENYAGGIAAVLITAFLFGIAHMSYGKIFPILMPMLMGVVLGFIVLKTKNLYSAIIAHVTFNITSLTLAYVGYELLDQIALIL
jgi:membrane protease YdiL (CAAX protease family)